MTARTVHPLGVAAKAGIWYLLADTTSGRRTFRVDRIRAVTLTDQPAIRPPDFDLAMAWRDVVADVDARRTLAVAVVLASDEAAEGLLAQFGADARIGRRRRDGRIEVHIGATSPLQLAERLAGWGDGIEVVRPREVRRQLAAIGAQLVELYSPRHSPAVPNVARPAGR